VELLCKREGEADVDFLREVVAVLVRGIMETEVTEKTGTGYGERSPEWVTQRNGYQLRPWDAWVGTLELRIPKVRKGSYYPSLLEPWRWSERSCRWCSRHMWRSIGPAVDDLVKSLGCEGISKSQVSRICQELDSLVEAFLTRPLDGGAVPLCLGGRIDSEGEGSGPHRHCQRGDSHCNEQ